MLKYFQCRPTLIQQSINYEKYKWKLFDIFIKDLTNINLKVTTIIIRQNNWMSCYKMVVNWVIKIN